MTLIHGYKISFDNLFIQNNVLSIWENIRTLVNNNLLVEEVCYKKNTGDAIVNPCGTIKTSINFPKSKDNLIFVRGSGENSLFKTLVLNGITMYQQHLWIKGKYIVDKISKIPFL